MKTPAWILTNAEPGGLLHDALDRLRQKSFAVGKSPPDELARLMSSHGSDKWGWLHNYTVAYSALFEPLRESATNILEVGIGTNYIDVPSTMGPNGVPGASLRGWRDYFKNAVVRGADVDRRILFKDDRIDTHYVDQLSDDALRAMWAEIGDAPFDIVIDDGLHTYEANRNCLLQSLPHVRDGGLYVIEDIVCGRETTDGVSGAQNVGRFADLLEGTGYQFALIALPHYWNLGDNMLGFVWKRPAASDPGFAARKRAFLDKLDSTLLWSNRFERLKRALSFG